MRHFFVSDLTKELLGPRNGAEECFALEDPRNEYSTGQLIPSNAQEERAPEQEDALAPEASSGEEDSDDQPPSYVNQAFIDAGQNFRRIPSSLGISFVLSHEPKAGDISVCVSWARYRFDEGKGWTRIPNIWIEPALEANSEDGLISPDGSLRMDLKVSKNNRTRNFKVSIYVSSVVKAKTECRAKSDEIIFQPEIRVSLKNPETLAELGDLDFVTEDKEWRVSTRQYDGLRIYARGHLCGAYWKEIDPQRPWGGHVGDTPQPPFVWIDGGHFVGSNDSVKAFFHPDVRSDFIPMYPAPASGASSTTGFKADDISECSSFDEVNNLLSPLFVEYGDWMDGLAPRPGTSGIDTEIIGRHREAFSRMGHGLDFLKDDKAALLSFLFMNKVMAKQYAWRKSGDTREMYWRPFQLAFILLTLESAVKQVEDRGICDTIWFPTGGGKTEAYLGLAAFTLAYRRRTAEPDSDGSAGGEGTCVISRYTLRLLTIQQFRRALKMIMACEILRCSGEGDSIGWVPSGAERTVGWMWGRSPFTIGLWVGSAVTPNTMLGEGFREIAQGAIPALRKPPQSDESDPAQIIECPCCGTLLSFPIEGVPAGEFKLRLFVVGDPDTTEGVLEKISTARIRVNNVVSEPHRHGKCAYLSLDLSLPSPIDPDAIHRWWNETAEPILGIRLLSFNAARPGYIQVQTGRRGTSNDYEIRCPNPGCDSNASTMRFKVPDSPTTWRFDNTHPMFSSDSEPTESGGIRIPAMTVDEELYSNPPSMLIATVDKLARMAFLKGAEAASLFGRVRSYSQSDGFSQVAPTSGRGRIAIGNFQPPWLIIQDELHLLEGPLGSAFGLFETAIEALCGRPKYIASSATIRNSSEQVQCLMARKSKVFPPPNIAIEEGFFLRASEVHPLDEQRPGRLFLGLAFPGRSPQTPMLRLWGRLLQTAQDRFDAIMRIEDQTKRNIALDDLDYFWTLVGYFNAVRELAQGEALLRQDIPQYIDKLLVQNAGMVKRDLGLAGFRNLSSQTRSSDLPGILAKMERTRVEGDALHAVASTSMFGTGVDITRLSLMVVHGQPKSASQYIQATGRIGRQRTGLAVVFFRVSKPRDLNHYEYFTGYHRKLAVAVEPISVKPFSPKALDRTTGALLAILLRNWRRATPGAPEGIELEGNGTRIGALQPNMLAELLRIFGEKCDAQAERRKPRKEGLLQFVRSQIERWQDFGRNQVQNGQGLPYTKVTNGNPVVLGEDHLVASVFPNVPQSLREVEPTINIFTEGD